MHFHLVITWAALSAGQTPIPVVALEPLGLGPHSVRR